jgi:hypothetical protein
VTHSLRFIVCHKHPVSGRLYFLHFASGDICGIQPLPKLAVLADCNSRAVEMHPAAALRELAAYLNLPENRLSILGEFKIYLDVPHQYAPDGLLPVYLAAVAGYELPLLPEGNRWIEMPDSFALPYLQREILRAAYEYLMG